MPLVQLLVPCLSSWTFTEPYLAISEPVRPAASEPWFICLLQCDSVASREPQFRYSVPSVTFSVSLALFQYFIQISVWFVLEVGLAFGRGLDSVHPRERPQPQHRSLLQYHHRSPRQYLRSLRDFDAIRHGWDLEPHRLCHGGELGGPGSPSGPDGESSSSRPQPSPVTSVTEATSSPQLSPASRIRRPLFVGNPITGNARLYRREFHQESYYDVSALRADPRYRESMRLIEDYSLLPFMTPRQHYYPRVVLQFYHSMTS